MLRKNITYFVFLLAVIYSLFCIFAFPRNSKLLEGEVLLSGIVYSEIEPKEWTDKLTFLVKEAKYSNQTIYPDEKIILYVPKYKNFSYLDELEVRVKLEHPENFLNENQIEFDYMNFLKKDGIFFIGKTEPGANIKIGSGTAVNSALKHKFLPVPDLKFYLYKIKRAFIDQTNKIFENPQAELLSGILLGEKKSLGKELEDNFRKSGLIHIIVLSGFNVTIIGVFLIYILGFLPKKISYPLGVIAIFLFSIMVGNGATVVRSAIMSTLALISKTNFATFNVNKALFFAGSIMVFINPYILLYDPSFQLSFLATFGLINLGGFMDKKIKFLPKNSIKETAIATISTQIVVLPLLIKMTGEVSLVAPIVNIITLPTVPMIMLFGFFSVVLSFINIKLGIIFSIIPNFLLSYLIMIVNYFASLPFATFNF